jgi:transglutaminase-like putative cysteine protease
MDLNYKFINAQYNKFSAKLDPVIENTDDKKVFSWQMENIPEIIPEPDMPPTSRSNPIILISTFSSWDEIYKWWHDLYKDKINIDSDIQNKINELIKDKNSEEEKLRSIYNFCAQDIRYVAVEYGQAGYEPHDAKEIFKNKYGDCKDQPYFWFRC